jgi:hypothetical protein
MNDMSTGALPISYKEDNSGNEAGSVRESVKKRAGSEPPFRKNLNAEAEEFSLLEAVTRERLVKT